MKNKNDYDLLQKQVTMMFEKETSPYSNMANFAALVYEQLSDLNWAGFYMWSEKEDCLLVHSFQGKAACTRINYGRGVCGTAHKTKTTQVVADVHKFDDHISCDDQTNSEIVIPLIVNGDCIGVFDVDSPKYSRFDDNDKDNLEKIVNIFLKSTDLTKVQS